MSKDEVYIGCCVKVKGQRVVMTVTEIWSTFDVKTKWYDINGNILTGIFSLEILDKVAKK